jgi:isopenicillin N synthase-like dioxygenase
LRAVARETGAFVLRGRTLDAALIDRVRDLTRAVFRLPPAELAAIDMRNSPHFRGWSPAGSELTYGRPDEREQLDFAPEEAPDPQAAAGPAYRRLRGPNQWPAALPALRPALLAWMTYASDVARIVVTATLAAIGAPPDAFGAVPFARDPFTRLKVVRYPASTDAGGQGVGTHRDTGLVTLILGDGTGGLFLGEGDAATEVAVPLDGLVVVFGRTFERLTGGVVVAAHHHVVSPPCGRERISVPFFFSPPLETRIAPIAVASEAASARERVVDGADLGTTIYGESALNVLLRSHPAAARRHHPDLVAPG